MTRDDYIRLLDEHDWHYEHSDDHGCWLQGRDERRELLRLRDEFDPEHRLWNVYCPDTMKTGVNA